MRPRSRGAARSAGRREGAWLADSTPAPNGLDFPADRVLTEHARHIDLYDRVDMIPFEKLETLFKENLK